MSVLPVHVYIIQYRNLCTIFWVIWQHKLFIYNWLELKSNECLIDEGNHIWCKIIWLLKLSNSKYTRKTVRSTLKLFNMFIKSKETMNNNRKVRRVNGKPAIQHRLLYSQCKEIIQIITYTLIKHIAVK